MVTERTCELCGWSRHVGKTCAEARVAAEAKGTTSRGRAWTGSVGTAIGARNAEVKVEGIERDLLVWWPLYREPTPAEWQGWAESLEARHERELGNASQKSEAAPRRRRRS